MYIVLHDSIKSNPATGHGREGYYFAENGEYTQYDAAKAVAEAIVAKGIGTLEPTPFTDEDYKQKPIVSGLQLAKFLNIDITIVLLEQLRYFGTNSRCRADRSRSIGWKPVKTDMLASIQPELDELLKKPDELAR